jgi:Flp pilus assembly protein CpaB
MVGVALDARPRTGPVGRRAWRSRVSTGHAVMVLAGLMGALFTLAALRSADDRVDVLVARADLAPGAIVQRDDFRTTRVNADASAMRSFVRADQVDSLVGRIVTTRVRAGRFVAPDDLQRAADGGARRSMSFPIERARALDGELVAGDRVDVVSVAARSGEAQFVATDVEVLRVGGASTSPLAGNDAVTVTLAVDPDIALAVATALHGDDLTLVRATGAAAIAAQP